MKDNQDLDKIFQQYKLCCENKISKEQLFAWIDHMLPIWQSDEPLLYFDLRLDQVNFTPPSDEFHYRILNLEVARYIDMATSIANFAFSASRVAGQVLKNGDMSLNLMIEAAEAYSLLPSNESQMRKMFNNLSSFFNDPSIKSKQATYEAYLLRIVNLLLKLAYNGMPRQLIYDCSVNTINAYKSLVDISYPQKIETPVLAFIENYIAPGLDPKLQGRLFYELTKIS